MLNILLAEDNPGDVLLVERALSVHHISHQMQVVPDGDRALEFLAEMGHAVDAPCPDLILLDLNLPKVDGVGVLTEFRKHRECAQTPVIIITSSDSQKDRSRVDGLGIARYFRKPSELNAFMQLGAIVREVADGEDE